jgi:hypothetical protein
MNFFSTLFGWLFNKPSPKTPVSPVGEKPVVDETLDTPYVTI